MKISVLTTGCYSNYSIVGVFSTMEKALDYKYKRRNVDDSDPEEYELDPELKVDKDFEIGKIYSVYIMTESGIVSQCSPEYIGYRHPKKCNIITEYADGEYGSIYVESPVSFEHATKVTIEERQRYLREKK